MIFALSWGQYSHSPSVLPGFNSKACCGCTHNPPHPPLLLSTGKHCSELMDSWRNGCHTDVTTLSLQHSGYLVFLSSFPGLWDSAVKLLVVRILSETPMNQQNTSNAWQYNQTHKFVPDVHGQRQRIPISPCSFTVSHTHKQITAPSNFDTQNRG